MAQKGRYIKTKSDYTLRKKHKSIAAGTIYEHDYMTISPMESLFAKDEYVLQDSNFKFSTRTGTSLQKKHKRGNWIPNGVCYGKMEDIWTLECMGTGGESDEGKIVLKPDYNSIKQFAYFGGAVQLVKASVNDIILNFPGEIYLTNDSLTVTQSYYENGNRFLRDVKVSGQKYAKNDYDINIDYTNVNVNDVYNPMRFFCLHAYDYVVEKPNGDINPVTSWTVTVYSGDTCVDSYLAADVIINGIHFKVYNDNNTGKKRMGYTGNYSGTSIHPSQEIIEEYFNKIDDFEKVLLNRDTNPIYTAKFITPKQTDTGFSYSLKYYTWPVLYGYSPELESPAFDIYYKSLIWLAEYHDEWDSDNIWRSMTHEAIKNLDWTFVRDNGNGIEDLSIIDNSRIVPVLKIWGRNLDDIKRFIDNIKACNTITYNGKNNLPDYFLTDTLEIGGWETKVLHLGTDRNERTEAMYPGMSRGYSSPETDIEFFRRLKLNSHYILRSKGTRNAIEQVLALFGITSGEYKITEHVAVANPKSGNNPYATGFAVSPSDNGPHVTYPLASEVEAINKSRTGFYGRHGDDGFAGIPVNVVSVSNNNSSGVTSYVVPWYTNGYDYDGGLYFQMNGGWFAMEDKDINLAVAPDVTKIYSTGDFTIYDETQTYLHFVSDLDGLKELSTENRKKHDVCYVTDLALVSADYAFKDAAEKAKFENNEFSHYFVLENEKLPFILGYSENSASYGWRNILTEEIENASTPDGIRVIYLESLESQTKGNNPHTGNGWYDGGSEYLRRMGQIFHYGLENGEFAAYGQTECDEIANYGFNITSGIIDDIKCWYFGDFGGEDALTCVRELGSGDTAFEACESPEFVTQGYAYNPEGGENTDEAAANSVINVKNVEMEFYCPETLNDDFKSDYKKFIDDVVMFYVKQVVPSTTILKYTVMCDGGSGFLTVSPSSLVYGNKETTTKTLSVNAVQQGWVASYPSWVEVTPEEGDEGTTTVSVTPTGSAGASERYGKIVFIGTKSGRAEAEVSQAGREPTPTYDLKIVRLNGGKTNDCPPYDVKAMFQTYSSSVHKPETLVSEVNVSDRCSWDFMPGTVGCREQAQRSEVEVMGSGESSYAHVTRIEGVPSMLTCAYDGWMVVYNEEGKRVQNTFSVYFGYC